MKQIILITISQSLPRGLNLPTNQKLTPWIKCNEFIILENLYLNLSDKYLFKMNWIEMNNCILVMNTKRSEIRKGNLFSFSASEQNCRIISNMKIWELCKIIIKLIRKHNISPFIFSGTVKGILSPFYNTKTASLFKIPNKRNLMILFMRIFYYLPFSLVSPPLWGNYYKNDKEKVILLRRKEESHHDRTFITIAFPAPPVIIQTDGMSSLCNLHS